MCILVRDNCESNSRVLSYCSTPTQHNTTISPPCLSQPRSGSRQWCSRAQRRCRLCHPHLRHHQLQRPSPQTRSEGQNSGLLVTHAQLPKSSAAKNTPSALAAPPTARNASTVFRGSTASQGEQGRGTRTARPSSKLPSSDHHPTVASLASSGFDLSPFFSRCQNSPRRHRTGHRLGRPPPVYPGRQISSLK